MGCIEKLIERIYRFFLTNIGWDGKILPLMPPSSRGPGRSPFKAKTGVRISVEAQKPPQGGFFIALLGSARISVEAQKPPQGGFFNALLGSARISVEAQKPPQGGFFIALFRSY